MKKVIYYLVMPLFFFICSCSENTDNSNNILPDAHPILLRAELQPRIDQDNTFAFDLFRATCQSEMKPNAFVSPLSVSMALSMTLNGAKNETRTEMEDALRISGFSSDDINEYCKTMREALLKADPSTQIAIANSIWYRWGFPVENNFLQINKNYFNAEIKDADFADQATVGRINKWCADNTNNKIPEILDNIPGDAVMYLINAVYFKGIWKSRFLKENTQQKPFYSANGQSQNVKMMNQEAKFNYAKDENAAYLELPYGNNAFSMVVMLPNEGKTVADITDNLNQETWGQIQNRWSVVDVNLEFPKFEVKCEYKMEDKILPSMGMKLPFTQWADFAGISRGGGIQISQVIHKTYANVDEEGTEAAAVTAVEVTFTSPGTNNKINFIVNKPFLFAIKEKSTGVILFIGKIGEIKQNN